MNDPVSGAGPEPVRGPASSRPQGGDAGDDASVTALVALGSNLAPRRATLAAAVESMARLPGTRLVAVSTLRETAPLDCPPGSGPFLNGAVLLRTTLTPRELLDACRALEAASGRVRGELHAPRRLDLDLIVHGDAQLDAPDLVLPHPRAHERLFVLEPAAELLPRARHPRLGADWTTLRDERRAVERRETPRETTAPPPDAEAGA